MSLRGYFIAGTDTGVGKTRVTVGLLGALRDVGVPALGMKAVASGTDAAGQNEDVELIRAANARAVAGAAHLHASAPGLREAENPYCFEWPISPHLAARRARISIEPARIVAAARALAVQDALILIEGTGGWLAPIGPGRTMADIAEALGLPVVLVVGLRLGCLNHALLTARAITAGPLRLAGWIASQVEGAMLAPEENVATLEERLPAARLALLPHQASPRHDAAQLAGAARALQRDSAISR
jgi:dethiobiotin synthetase